MKPRKTEIITNYVASAFVLLAVFSLLVETTVGYDGGWWHWIVAAVIFGSLALFSASIVPRVLWRIRKVKRGQR